MKKRMNKNYELREQNGSKIEKVLIRIEYFFYNFWFPQLKLSFIFSFLIFQTIILNMILRSFNKENIAHQSGQLIDIANKQAALSSDGSFETLQEKKEELSIHEINSQVLQRELIRFSESMEAQRRDKNRLTQGLAKMDEEVKILKA